MTLITHTALAAHSSSAARAVKAAAAIATAGAVLAAPAPSLAAGKTASVADTVQAVRSATDNSNLIVETERESGATQGRLAFAVYSDRKLKLSATFLEGFLSDQGLGDVQYADDGKCFVAHRFPQFVGLTEIGDQLLPQAGVRYTVSGRTIRWTIPAVGAQSDARTEETGTVTFNSRDRITASDAASYRFGGSKGKVETVQASDVAFSYPTSLPTDVPKTAPARLCAKAARAARVALLRKTV